jgi:hypothetical protein
MVNTFLVSSDLQECVKALDFRRLGKQRVEGYQLWLALTGQRQGWRNHPAAKMWDGYVDALALYTNACIDEWKARGYKNTMQHMPTTSTDVQFPPWWGWPPLLHSHKASLNRKDASYYHFEVPDDYAALGYVWPHTVAAHLRWQPDAAAADVCAPVSVPPPKKTAKPRAVKQPPKQPPTPRAGTKRQRAYDV